ncbi:MAG TPA: zinc ribbon domain-containing protein [Polyangiaceae bacterium]|nr:zinc ribbon domain-containing protein [Polyangiaceae bacterium]
MTYSYICTSCGHEWEAEQRISEAPLQVCPSCNQSSAKRQIAGPANFILKGGGWYSDLYSSSTGKKSEADKGTSSSDKADKPAEKPAEKIEKADKPAEKKSDASSSSASSSAASA